MNELKKIPLLLPALVNFDKEMKIINWIGPPTISNEILCFIELLFLFALSRVPFLIDDTVSEEDENSKSDQYQNFDDKPPSNENIKSEENIKFEENIKSEESIKPEESIKSEENTQERSMPTEKLIEELETQLKGVNSTRGQKKSQTQSESFSLSQRLVQQFQIQEKKRYETPDQPFVYQIGGVDFPVPPITGGKFKASDKGIFLSDKPLYLNLLVLVREASARLPGGVGTRKDITRLILQSQYVKQDTPKAQLNTALSGALERLQSETDNCVKFLSELQLWICLHKFHTPDDYSHIRASKKKKEKKE